ncbi:Elongator subunit ELP2 Ecym_7373 [Eremothecium cymbalariae DBVPG|uniref:Elongator complex protein 2 n=1 Tax=Eremothecium cymbalariae (strain CBS 270.75 / DBVPG 7215 / KCTC 17166 / NRRL Y-17582) TaxID=931890 RepID=G8JWI4_ERECY|nr:hypothetical protein Ecym_7373 [Eremothecium cymbalariae DBVPG\
MLSGEAIFIGANKQSQVSDYYAPGKCVAFGAGKTIALWNPLDANCSGVYATLKGHDAEVICVKFIPEDKLMVSASEDCKIKIWKGDEEWELIQTLEQNEQSITAITASPGLLIVGAANGSISLWKQSDSGFEFDHRFQVRERFLPLCLALCELASGSYLLAVGGSSVNVEIYAVNLNEDSISCKPVATLEGHEDWVKALDFRYNGPDDFVLASGSQDKYIRLWRVRANEKIERDDSDKLTLLSNKKYEFQVNEEIHAAINFEALIMGHDDWISSLKWHDTRYQLLASTADTSVIVWEPDEHSGIWVCASRLGEFSFKGSSTATGSAGGFWSCLWFHESDKEYILTNGKTGSWRSWESCDGGITWNQKLAISGPKKAVTDVAWSRSGKYLFCTSLDQTTRLYAQWLFDSNGARSCTSWNEFSRPQIHGYDMICIEPISDTRFISAGDEKVLRAFDEPKAIAQLLNKLSGIEDVTGATYAEAAMLPALGLSNKATQDENDDDDPNAMETAENVNITADLLLELFTPPFEDQLQRHTLWPEIEKLYGHGYEISTLDVSPDATLAATACKSNNSQNALIRIFDTQSWLQLRPTAEYHNLTITRLKFSRDNRYLLSVSRDRRWAVWERNFETNTFQFSSGHEKPHSRIIWDCDWMPLEFGDAFVTVSRDKTIKLWRSNKRMDIRDSSNGDNGYELEQSLRLGEAVTAVSVYSQLVEGKVAIAMGCESGAIHIYTYSGKNFDKVVELDTKITPADRINRIRWNPVEKDGLLFIGVGSLDTSTRIYSIGRSTL